MMVIAFYALAFLILAASLAVVVLPNPVYGALCLVAALLGVSGIFALLGAHFLAVAQIIVYAGAIVVLFLFVVMLLNVKQEEYRKGMAVLSAAAAAFGVSFIILLVPVLRGDFGAIPAGADISGGAAALGELLFTRHVLAFEAASVLLMAALVAAVMLGRRRLVSGEKQI